MTRRSIFITGGASGIGRATARYFGERGWFVGIADVNVEGMEDTLGLIEGGFKYMHRLDVRDRKAWDEALAAFNTAAGSRIDVMVNNAGIGTGGALAELDVAMNGDKLREARQMAAVPGIAERIGRAVGGMASTTYGPTGTWIEDLTIAEQDFKPWLATLRRVIDTELPAFDAWLDAQGAPWTPGRLPKFE